MSQLRDFRFWLHLLGGWFVVTIALSLVLAILGSDDMTPAEGWAASIAIQIAAITLAYQHANHRRPSTPDGRRGFPVEPASRVEEGRPDD